jgi:hypothetical protein
MGTGPAAGARVDRQRQQRRRVDCDARVRGRGEPGKQGPDRRRQPARLLAGDAAHDEQIQGRFPQARLEKALNTMNFNIAVARPGA